MDISDYHIHTLKVTEDSISCYFILKENYLMLNQVPALQEHLLQKLLILGPYFLFQIYSEVNFLSTDMVLDDIIPVLGIGIRASYPAKNVSSNLPLGQQLFFAS